MHKTYCNYIALFTMRVSQLSCTFIHVTICLYKNSASSLTIIVKYLDLDESVLAYSLLQMYKK